MSEAGGELLGHGSPRVRISPGATLGAGAAPGHVAALRAMAGHRTTARPVRNTQKGCAMTRTGSRTGSPTVQPHPLGLSPEREEPKTRSLSLPGQGGL